MGILPETLTLNRLFGMSTSINLSSNILEAAKVAAEKSDLTLDAYVEQAVRHALGRAGESTQASAPVELPAFDCGGASLIDLDDKNVLWKVLDDHS